MEATRSSETSIDFQRTTRRYIPEYRALQRLDNFLMALECYVSSNELIINILIYFLVCINICISSRAFIDIAAYLYIYLFCKSINKTEITLMGDT
jgi:hypothetical protein